MSLKIQNIEPNTSSYQQFIDFPTKIYPKESSKLQMTEDFDHRNLKALYSISNGEKIEARAALYYNPDLKYEGKKTFSLGNYEATEDPEASRLLIEHIAKEAKKQGAKYLLGPMNGSTWGSYRFAENTGDAFFLEPDHLDYYKSQFHKAGFEIIRTYNSKLVEKIPVDSAEHNKEIHHLQESLEVKVRTINMDSFKQELEKLHDLVHCAFNKNFLFSPISQKLFVQKYRSTDQFLNRDFTHIAEDKHGNFLAFFFCMDDHFHADKKTLIIKTIARHPDPKWRGLGQLMGSFLYQKARERGYDTIIHALMDENASSSSISTKFSGEPINRYFLYAKEL